MKDILQAALVVLVISISRTKGYGLDHPVKDNIPVPMRKGITEVESRQVEGNLGETVNNLTKDYIKGVINPTPEEVHDIIIIVSSPFDLKLSGVAWSLLPICQRLHLQTSFWDVCHGSRLFSLQSLFQICPAVIWCFNRASIVEIQSYLMFLKTVSTHDIQNSQIGH